MQATILRSLSLWWFWIDWGSLILAVISVPSVLVRRRGRPAAALAWIMALLSVPLLGLTLWWLFGRSHLERRRRRKARAHKAMTERFATLRGQLNTPASQTNALVSFKTLPTDLADSVFEPTGGNEVQVLDSHEAFDVMERDIRAATHHIHALFYIWKNDETGRRFCKALIDRAKEGIEVRVLCDAIGSPVMATRFSRPLRRAGVKVARFLPPQILSLTPRLNFRNHRKILVVDGEIGVIGGFNIADEYRKTWRDLGLRVRGPAVDQLQEIFADDWYYATTENLADMGYFGRWKHSDSSEAASCATIASGPDTRYAPLHDALFMAMNQADSKLYIMTPYFIPSRAILAALRAAVYRGVDVRIMLPAFSDVMLVRYAARSYYPELLEIGARIFEYQPSMLHAKVTIFDDQLILCGSANLDSRSFKLNFEASCFVSSRRINAQLTELFLRDVEHCKEVSLADVLATPWLEKIVDATAHLLSPLL